MIKKGHAKQGPFVLRFLARFFVQRIAKASLLIYNIYGKYQ